MKLNSFVFIFHEKILDGSFKSSIFSDVRAKLFTGGLKIHNTLYNTNYNDDNNKLVIFLSIFLFVFGV